VNGLGWIEAETVKFNSAGKDSPRIPHMGWNSLKIRKQSVLMQGLGPDSLFYFVHSYHVQCQRDNDVLSTTHYGITFTSSVERENIFGTQFHPEKSYADGIRLLENFCNIKST
jgi:glutamine amidotransferase